MKPKIHGFVYKTYNVTITSAHFGYIELVNVFRMVQNLFVIFAGVNDQLFVK